MKSGRGAAGAGPHRRGTCGEHGTRAPSSLLVPYSPGAAILYCTGWAVLACSELPHIFMQRVESAYKPLGQSVNIISFLWAFNVQSILQSS